MHKYLEMHFLLFLLSFAFLASNPVCAAEDETGAELFMRDGQLKSHPVRIFVTRDISEAMKPQLLLVASHALTKPDQAETRPINPRLVARHQRSKQIIQGEEVDLTGTLMLFNLKDYPIPPYKGMMRVVPVLKWHEKRDNKIEEHTLIGPHEVNVGNIVPAALWTVFFVGLLIAAIVIIAKQTGKKATCLLCGPMGRLSLAHTQVALWTAGVGTMVAGYGFLRFQVPDIPESLVVLMGLSITTGGISQYRATRLDGSSNIQTSVSSSNKIEPRLFHLISEIKEDGSEGLSLPRAQMVFWTGITLILFIVKSLLDGVLWEVPWEMVAFMGLSQAGYLSPKWMQKAPEKEDTEPHKQTARKRSR